VTRAEPHLKAQASRLAPLRELIDSLGMAKYLKPAEYARLKHLSRQAVHDRIRGGTLKLVMVDVAEEPIATMIDLRYGVRAPDKRGHPLSCSATPLLQQGPQRFLDRNVSPCQSPQIQSRLIGPKIRLLILTQAVWPTSSVEFANPPVPKSVADPAP
jgi:hypothetical protein